MRRQCSSLYQFNIRVYATDEKNQPRANVKTTCGKIKYWHFISLFSFQRSA